MPAIEDGPAVVRNARRLLDGARLLRAPVLFTEQNAKRLGGTLPELLSSSDTIAHKLTFDACNASSARIKWKFTSQKARNKLARAYPDTTKES